MKTRRSELGDLVAVIPRPFVTLRNWVIAAATVVIVVALSPHTTASDVFQIIVMLTAMLLLVKHLGAIRVFEHGMESYRARMLWKNLVAYRLDWSYGYLTILLIEQATFREFAMLFSVFHSDKFRDAVGDRANLDALVKIG
jgi:hypothetical protein